VVRAARLWSAFAACPCAAHLPARDRSLPAFQEALRAWLEAVPGSLRDSGEPPEAPLLSEPCTVRLRIHLWRGFWHGCTDRGGLRPRLVRRWLASGMRGTPEGRRMAAAVLYWRVMPERPEPVWGDWGAEVREPISMEEWRAGTARFLGAPVAPGKGSREALRRLLAAFDPI
jgi:hypothetical protein